MHDVQPVSFRGPHGHLLFGTLHRPAAPAGDLPAVVLMSPGVKMRVGPGRLYVPITDALVARGHTVLRFDFHGLGDSEGELQEAMLADVYNHIEAGRYAGDALAALEWMRREQGHRRFIVAGLCGGGVTALYAAQRDPSVEALFAIGITVTLSSDAVLPAAYLSTAELVNRRKGYMRRLFSLRSWWRLLTFQSEFGVIFRSLFAKAGRPPRPPAIPAGSALTPEQLGNVNPMFAPAFFDFLGRGGRALLVFSEKDREYGDFQEKFAAFHADRLKAHAAQVTEHLVPGANHVMSLREWQQETLDVLGRWLAGPSARG